MSGNDARVSAAQVAIQSLQRQFEAGALKHPLLEHHYSEHQQGDEPPVTASRCSPPHGCPWAGGLLRSSLEIHVDAMWLDLSPVSLDRPLVWVGWYIGPQNAVADFMTLAESAGQLVKSYRVQPPLPDWLDLALSKMILHDNKHANLHVIIPNELQRWVRFLHWLGWSGDVMPTNRETWDLASTWDLELRRKLAPGTTEHRIYSKIDNLFVRSCAALAWIAERLQKAMTETDPKKQEAAARQPVDPSPARSDDQRTSRKMAKQGGDARKRNRLYRKIVAAGNQMTHGQKGKRKKLAEHFKADIAKLNPDVEPVRFVIRAFAYCSKHRSKSPRN